VVASVQVEGVVMLYLTMLFQSSSQSSDLERILTTHKSEPTLVQHAFALTFIEIA